MEFRKLFEPVSIGAMKVKNRIVMAPTGTNFPGDGSVTRKALSFYGERAKGGVGLIIAEGVGIDPRYGLGLPTQLNLFVDRFLPTFKELSSAIKEQDVRTGIQFFHPGTYGNAGLNPEKKNLSPSGIPTPGIPGETKVMDLEDIEYVQEVYLDATDRARKAGFDSVLIHAAEGLIHQFLSPYYNKRKDDYGGAVKGRMRFLIEIVTKIRRAIGRNFPILCRINGEDRSTQITVEDSQAVAKELEKAGVDAIELINGAMIESLGTPIYSMGVTRGNFSNLSEAIKRLVNIPVISNIRINHPQTAENILKDRKADLVSMSRAFLSDPEWPNKAASGRSDDINQCIACCCCLDESFKCQHVKCAINARTGFEDERRIEPTDRVKRVFVVGGGPAGLEAARVSALRGHRVSLYEKESNLGGQLLVAVRPPHKEEINSLTDYLVTQVRNQGVHIIPGQEVTVNLIQREKPDVVVVATGALPTLPEIPVEDGNVVFATDILNGKVQAGKKILIIGGGLVGMETAEFLAREKREMTIVEILDRVCADMPIFARDDLMRRIRELGMKILTETEVERIKGGTVILRQKDRRQTLEVDTVVIATGYRPDRMLSEELEGVVPEYYRIGDCEQPRRILEAIHEGFVTGSRL